jgi:hypothetical protein
MNEKEIDVYFSLNQRELSTGVFKKTDHSLIFSNVENININSLNEYTNFEILKKTIEKNIRKIEKNINSFVTNIFLMIDTNESISIYISLMKKLDNKKIQQKDIKYLIQDAKLQILKTHPEMTILHIIVKKYVVNDLDYNFVPVNINCNKISIDIQFICFSKNLTKKIETLFNHFQISVDRIICSKYAKSFMGNENQSNICQIGHNLNKGLNKQEVLIVPKKNEKSGFFEKLFHFFK